MEMSMSGVKHPPLPIEDATTSAKCTGIVIRNG